MYGLESETKREMLFSQELRRELSPSEREFLENEKQHAFGHHENMAKIMDKYPNFKVLFIDATDKGTVGSDFFKELDPELLDYFSQIHTGTNFNKNNFRYEEFSEQLFKYMFGFKPDDLRFQTIRTINQNSSLPISTVKFDLVLGSGGEVNQLDTQPEYAEQLKKIKTIFEQVINTKTPFLATCATHQIIGELIHEMDGGEGTIIDNLHDEHGNELTESGVIDLFASEQTKISPLAINLPKQFSIMSNHGQYLTQIPKGATSLAENRFQNNLIQTQLLGYENGIGIQAHPEFSPAVILARNRLARAEAAWEGKELPTLAEVDPRATWQAREILFPAIVEFAANHKNI